tara:strand:- start:472 stop:1065 length:594 start_codon:yes stop_codon:yes gene_type:complete
MHKKRIGLVKRKTNETNINLELNIDGSGQTEINSGIGFLDHMLDLLSFHALFDLKLDCKGDLEIDTHHTTEDIAISMGLALNDAVGEKKGIFRYGFSYVPMDEALIRTVLDFSGRPEFIFSGKFSRSMLGNLDTQMITHFFKSISIYSRITLHMSILYGLNDHHKCEGLFKSFGQALRAALDFDPRREGIVSTKGSL